MIAKLKEAMRENKILPFSTPLPINHKTPFYTKDAKKIYVKTCNKISSYFIFPQTKSMLGLLSQNTIEENVKFFSESISNNFLKEISEPKGNWQLPYELVIVTEDPKTYSKISKLGVTCELLTDEYQLSGIERYEIIRAIDCDRFQDKLYQLDQCEFIETIDQVFPEKNLKILSAWLDNLKIINKHISNSSVSKLVELESILDFKKDRIDSDSLELKIRDANTKLMNSISSSMFSGADMISMVQEGKLPDDLRSKIKVICEDLEIPIDFVTQKIPLELDMDSVNEEIKRQEIGSSMKISERIAKNKNVIMSIPKVIEDIMKELILIDIRGGICSYKKENNCTVIKGDAHLKLQNASNIFLSKSQPISYYLDDNNKATLLTGANSGGKTTLLEHIMQLITLQRLGIPAAGNNSIPKYSEVYYFAKSKGSQNKGAFETMLTQLSKIKISDRTLILADEMEAVTEPSVAAKIIGSTIKFYLEKNCNLIFATHLGEDIKKSISSGVRIDGICAKGLDSNNEVIIDHNPILGKIAKSTPELIVSKMAIKSDNSFLQNLNACLQKT